MAEKPESFPISKIHSKKWTGAGFVPLSNIHIPSHTRQPVWCVLVAREKFKSNKARVPLYEDIGGGLDNPTEESIAVGAVKELREETAELLWIDPKLIPTKSFLPIDTETRNQGTWYRSYACVIPRTKALQINETAGANLRALHTNRNNHPHHAGIPTCWLEMDDWKWIPLEQFAHKPAEIHTFTNSHHKKDNAYGYTDLYGNRVWISGRMNKILTNPKCGVLRKNGKFHNYSTCSFAKWMNNQLTHNKTHVPKTLPLRVYNNTHPDMYNQTFENCSIWNVSGHPPDFDHMKNHIHYKTTRLPMKNKKK